jgi:flagellar basal body-associated protein FliL
MKEISEETEFSSAIALIILIVVTITVAITVAVWLGSLSIEDPTKINIHSQIYSTNHDVGVLNEDAIFDIWIENNLKENRRFNIVLGIEENEVYSETVELVGLEKRNMVINQRLFFTGSWTIKIFEENKIMDQYSFVTLPNDVEAELEITRIDQTNFINNLLINILIVLVFFIIVGVVTFWFFKVRRKSLKNDIKKEIPYL